MSKKQSSDETRSVECEIEIETLPAEVWRALTDARELERWFPLEARVESGEGGSIHMSWRNEYAGSSNIVAWEPERLLRTTWGFEGEGPGGAVQFTDYRIEGSGGRTLVRVVTSGFPEGPDWDDWFESTHHGWRFELRSLKHYLERHAGKDRGVVYLRRRVPLTREAIWERLFGEGGVGPRPLDGVTLLDDAPHQYAAVLPDLNAGLLRLSTDPCMGGAGRFDVTFWVSAWGHATTRLEAIEAEWGPKLAALFPEGADPDAT